VDVETGSESARGRIGRKYARGVAYWTDGTEERIVTITPGFQLVELNAKTGLPVGGFGQAARWICLKRSTWITRATLLAKSETARRLSFRTM